MVIVFGHKHDFKPLGTVDVACPKCGRKPCTLEGAHKKATIYWVPLFEMGTSYTLWCESCKQHWMLDKTVGQRLQFELQGRQPETISERTAPAGARDASAVCANCMAPLAQGARFCQECGTPVSQPTSARSCPSCGKPQSLGAFCANCGARIDA